MSKLLSLPEELKMRNPFPPTEKDFTDSVPLVIKPNDRGWPTLILPEGTCKPSRESDIIKYLTNHPHYFTNCLPGEIDSLFKFLTTAQLTELFHLGSCKSCGCTINYLGDSFSIVKRGKYHYIWNIVNFFTKPFRNDLDTIYNRAELLQYFLESNNIPITTLATPASLSRHFMMCFPEIVSEIYYAHKLDLSVLDAFDAACYGGRMECSGIGARNLNHYDTVKAHLAILEDIPSIDRSILVENDPYIEDALAGVYLINTVIPTRKYKFQPLPLRSPPPIPPGDWPPDFMEELRDPNPLLYIGGPITNQPYPKPYLDLLRILGIDFEVISSIQFFNPRGKEKTYPYREWAREIREILDRCDSQEGAQAVGIYLKSLYNTAVGSSKYIAETYNPKTRETKYESSRVFNPILFSQVHALLNCFMWYEAHTNDAELIRVDAISTPGEKGSTNENPFLEHYDKLKLALRDKGDTIVITPYIKAFPGGKGKLYADYIEDWPEADRLEWEYSSRYRLKSKYGCTDPIKLASLKDRPLTIKPTHGFRQEGSEVDRIGELRSKWFPNVPFEELPVNFRKHAAELRDMSWIDFTMDSLEALGGGEGK